MKKFQYTLYTAAIAALVVISCNKDLPTEQAYESYTFSPDANGGTWKSILITTPDQIAIDNPADATSATYKAELENLKAKMNSVGAAEREAIAYWTNNPVIRWNEIARELAAKYNLTPAPNEDGTYPAPDVNNPGKYPKYPFAHPPYACRAFAYLSVAQYDALIASWHYKYKFSRKSPSQYDSSIKSAYPDQIVPSYPSDAAVIAAVSREILTAMFPLEKEFLAQKAEELKNTVQYAGLNVKSDVDAGEALGTAIAKIALQRASGDGMRQAQAPRAVSDSLANESEKKFGWRWINMESPRRPVGIAPLYGKVKMWNVPSVEAVRPPAPPAIGSPEFNKAADELRAYAQNMTAEQRKIANWWSDGLGTYTPPGHWNRFACNFIVQYQQSPIRSARTLAYMNMAIMDAGISCWDAKYYYNYPRPINAMPDFKTILGTPNFPGYTSGHSTFSSAAATVLGYIFPNESAQCQNWAKEAAESRIYGGIHFRFDSEAGMEQGRKVAQYAVDIAKKDGAQ